MQIISKRKSVEIKTYYRDFEWRQAAGSGFRFECDERGNLLVPHEGLAACEANPLLRDFGVTTITHRRVEPTVGRCGCGQEVVLDGFTNACNCGRDYSMSGQLLAPREQWGEETGESLDEILSIP